jgi:signal peptidase I
MNYPTEPPQPPAARKSSSFLREAVETILIAVILFLLLQLVVKNFRIIGDSMQPNFHDGEMILVDRVTYRFSEPKRGDVVVFHYPRAPQEDYIKRVIGLPGETVAISTGDVYINGNPISEPYIDGQRTTTYRNSEITLGADEYFVMGDNRGYSSDSRAWGPLPRRYIIGRALVCYWPPSCWAVFSTPEYP